VLPCSVAGCMVRASADPVVRDERRPFVMSLGYQRTRSRRLSCLRSPVGWMDSGFRRDCSGAAGYRRRSWRRLIRALGGRLDAVAGAAELYGSGGGGYGTAVGESPVVVVVAGVHGFPVMWTSFIVRYVHHHVIRRACFELSEAKDETGLSAPGLESVGEVGERCYC
jgi:hypothetical protein